MIKHIVETGSWSHKYAFEHIKDAVELYTALSKAQKCDTTYDDGEYAYPVETTAVTMRSVIWENEKRVKVAETKEEEI